MKSIFISLILLFCITTISASLGYDNPTLPKLNSPEVSGTQLIEGANYTINTNNSQYLQGYTWLTNPYFASWSTTYNSSYVPYQGATANVNLSIYNISTSTLIAGIGNKTISIGEGVQAGDSSWGFRWEDKKYPNRIIGQNVINSMNLMNFGVNSPNVGGGDTTNPTGVQFQLDARGLYGLFKIYQQKWNGDGWNEYEAFAVTDKGFTKVGYSGIDGEAVLMVRGGDGDSSPYQGNISLAQFDNWDSTKKVIIDNETNIITSGNINSSGNITGNNIYGKNICYSNGTGCSTFNSSYVPYTGATKNVNLGTNDLTMGSTTITESTASTAGLTIRGYRPNIFMETDPSTGGVAFNIFSLKYNSSTYNISNVVGSISMYGTDSGGNPRANYMSLDAKNSATPWVNATMIIDVNQKVGINLNGINRPTETLDVGGNIKARSNFVLDDDSKYYLGTGNDASIYYDGTNLILNPKEVGSGWLDILGSTNITGNLEQTQGNATINNYYGYVWFHNDTGISAGTLNDTYQTLAVFSMGQMDSIKNGFINTSQGLTLITDGGVYQADWKAVGTGTQNHDYHGCLFINEVCQYGLSDHVIGTANNEVVLSSNGKIRITAGDNVTIRVRDVGSTSAGTVVIAHINLDRVAN